jgi:hypothetical protein
MEPWEEESSQGQQAGGMRPASSGPLPLGDRPTQIKVLVSAPSRRGKPSKPAMPESSKPNQASRDPAQVEGDRPAHPPSFASVKVWVSPQSRWQKHRQALKDSGVERENAINDDDSYIDEYVDEDDAVDEAEDGDRPDIRVLAVVKPKGGWKSALLTTGLLCSLAAVTFGGWVAFQLIINPGSIPWMQWMFPAEVRGSFVADDTPQTLGSIHTQAKKAGLVLGSPLLLGKTGALMIPVSASACSDGAIAPCSAISELRVYRPFPNTAANSNLYQLVDRLAVPGLEEYFVVAPVATTTLQAGSKQRLPFTAATQIEGTPPNAGVWFQVSGTWARGSTRLLYGQVMSYDSRRERLETQLRWTSPAEALPHWQDIIGGGATELVVNQTLGLEPDFQLYRVKSVSSGDRSLQLEAITLTQPALKTRTYEQGLILARSGLWTPALQLLQSIKDRSQGTPAKWTATAQAQLDLIRLHADVTKAQAERTWASDSQQITALLIDGRWGAALDRLRKALKDGSDLTNLLQDDSRVIGRRVEAALQINRAQLSVQAWGALCLAVQQGRRAAIAWLQAQQPQAAVRNQLAPSPQLQAILNLILSLATPEVASSHPSRFIGTVTRLSTINPNDWTVAPATPSLTLEPQQTWYQIQVSRFHDGDRWWRSPFTNLNLPLLGITQELWAVMGLATDNQVQLMTWTPEGLSQTTEATVKAIRFRNGAIQLLAAGDTPTATGSSAPSQPLALTANTLQWLDPINTLSLNELVQQQPAWAETLVPTLWQELQRAEQVSRPATTMDDMLAEIGTWPVQLRDVTGNNQPDAIITFQPTPQLPISSDALDVSAQTDATPSRTLILSEQGKLLYSDLVNGQTMVAIAEIDSISTPTLIIDMGQTYGLRQWSVQTQRFQ